MRSSDIDEAMKQVILSKFKMRSCEYDVLSTSAYPNYQHIYMKRTIEQKLHPNDTIQLVNIEIDEEANTMIHYLDVLKRWKA